MSKPKRSAPEDNSQNVPSLYQRKALRALRKAWLAAGSEGAEIWQYAVEIDELCALGLSRTDLRDLLQWGYVEHAQECTKRGSGQRIFRVLPSLALPKRTCFVLTQRGFEIASEKRRKEDVSPAPSPRWDRATRQLWFRNILVKEFHGPAPNQEMVLEAFEEVGWPARLDDPLQHSPGIDPKVRLHDTIKALNQHQKHRVLRFGGDGTGFGVRWFLMRRH